MNVATLRYVALTGALRERYGSATGALREQAKAKSKESPLMMINNHQSQSERKPRSAHESGLIAWGGAGDGNRTRVLSLGS